MPALLTGIFAVPEAVPVSARLGSEDRNLCLLRAQFVEASLHNLPGIGYAPYVPIRYLDSCFVLLSDPPPTRRDYLRILENKSVPPLALLVSGHFEARLAVLT